jgi:selenide,water dikinase
VLVDASGGDDAAVVRVGEDRALVMTTDFFTPIVDDPYAFGQIAAANAMSDVYAMGGRPLYCLNLVGWPRDMLPMETLGEVLRGAADVVSRAGAVIVGGHSIDDPEPKFGLVVVGEVDPSRITTNAAARPGDVLVLTKPIGTGIIATAIKKSAAPQAVVRRAVACMTTLNDGAAEAARAAGVRAATDVTGFGLLGHLRAMMAASGTAAEVWAGSVPRLPDTESLARAGHVPGGTRRNLESLLATTRFDDALDPTERIVLADAQTSGGLLLCVPPSSLSGLLEDLRARDTPAAAVVGRVGEGEPGSVVVHAGSAPNSLA